MSEQDAFIEFIMLLCIMLGWTFYNYKTRK